MQQARGRFGRFVVSVVALLVGLAAAGLGALPAGAAPSGSISGRVVDTNGNPVADVCVNADSSGTTTDANGQYTVTAIGTGSFTVRFSDCSGSPSLAPQYYQGHTGPSGADQVAVTDGADTPLPDVTMQPGVAVTGTVTDPNGNPLPNVNVWVNSEDVADGGYGFTDANGTYTTGPLAAGNYRVGFGPNDPQYAQEWWVGHAAQNQGDTLTLDPNQGSVHGGVDAQVQSAATLSGTVTDPNGNPLGSICVGVSVPNNSGGTDGVNGTTTQADGTYSITGLFPTTVYVQFSDCSGNGYISRWYGGTADFNTATPITLTAGTPTTGIDAQLSQGTRFSGRVTDANGNPIQNIGVSVEPTGNGSGAWAQTDSNGNYATNAVDPGTYRVQFQGNGTYATEYWDDHWTRNDADVITISAGDGPVHGGVDAQLAVGSTVTGTVVDENGAPAPGICVYAVTETSQGLDGVSGTETAADGTYTLGGVPPIGVKVGFQDCHTNGPFATQWFDGQTNLDNATEISLTSGATRAGVDAQLVRAGVIRGTVTDASSAPVENACVQATSDSSVGGFAQTQSDGSYALTVGLPGTYKVQFFDCRDHPTLAGEWWNDQPTSATATAVTVAAGQTVSGIDAQLQVGATSTLSGRVTNARGTAMTTACAVAYIPSNFVRFSPVAADGTYTFTDLPSATYALAFVGCPTNGDEDASPYVADPDVPGISYPAVWWNNVPLSLGGGEQGPDPVAQGATLVTVGAGQHLTGYDVCFGCTSIVITSITPGPTPGSLVVAFTAPDFSGASGAGGASAAARPNVLFTVTCSSPNGGVTGSASGSGSPITVSGLTVNASYACQVAASVGGTVLATSASSSPSFEPAGSSGSADPAGDGTAAAGASGSGSGSGSGGALAYTGTDSAFGLVRAGIVLLLLGGALVVTTRRRRAAALEATVDAPAD